MSRSLYGGVMTSADPPPVPGVNVAVADAVNNGLQHPVDAGLVGHVSHW